MTVVEDFIYLTCNKSPSIIQVIRLLLFLYFKERLLLLFWSHWLHNLCINKQQVILEHLLYSHILDYNTELANLIMLLLMDPNRYG